MRCSSPYCRCGTWPRLCGECGCCLAFFFFFQAEDGIRDLTVTGVQTCALPILRHTRFVQLSLAALVLAALVGGSLPAQSSASPAKRQSSAAPSTGAAKPTIVLDRKSVV